MSTEKATQKAILDYLTLKGIFHYRQNTGAFKDNRGNLYRFGAKGSPDIVMVVDGRYVGIEVKDSARTSSMSDSQREFKERLEKAGGLYILARSLDDVMAYI